MSMHVNINVWLSQVSIHFSVYPSITIINTFNKLQAVCSKDDVNKTSVVGHNEDHRPHPLSPPTSALTHGHSICSGEEAGLCIVGGASGRSSSSDGLAVIFNV